MESERIVCPVDVTLNLINKKWSIQIIRDMFFGKKHFNEFKEDKPKLSNKVLSICLKELEEKGLIEKVVLNTTPVTTEYYLFNNGVLNLYDRNFTKTTNFTDYFTTKKMDCDFSIDTIIIDPLNTEPACLVDRVLREIFIPNYKEDVKDQFIDFIWIFYSV